MRTERHGRIGLLASLLLLTASASLVAASGTTAAERYELASGDVLQLSVFGRPDLSGSFRVGADDSLSLPVIGKVDVAGKDRNEVQAALVAAFTRAMSTQAKLTLEIETYRPFFVLGAVNKPGGYPYQPGIVVLQAMAVAGGAYSLAQNGNADLIVQARREQEQIDTSVAQLTLLLARHARLLAEQRGEKVVTMPPRLLTLAGEKEAERLIGDETAMMHARAESLARQVENQLQARRLAEKHIVDLKGQLDAFRRQQDLTQQELAVAEGLKEKALTTSSRVLDLQRASADLTAQMLDVQSSIDSAEQEVVKYANAATQLPMDRALQVAEDLKAAEGDIAVQSATVNASATTIHAITGVEATTNAVTALVPSFTIMRKSPDGFRTLKASETDRLLPGDVLTVRYDTVSPSVSAAPVSARQALN